MSEDDGKVVQPAGVGWLHEKHGHVPGHVRRADLEQSENERKASGEEPTKREQRRADRRAEAEESLSKGGIFESDDYWLGRNRRDVGR